MANEVKLALLLAAVLAVFGGGYWVAHMHEEATVARMQKAHDDDVIAAKDAVADKIKDLTAQRDMAQQANEAISNEFQSYKDHAAADASDLAKRLSDSQATAAAYSSALSKAGNKPSPVTGPAPPSVGQLNEATGSALAECKLVRTGYEDLLKELRPQLAVR